MFQNEEVGEEFVNDSEVVQEENTEDWQLVPDTDGNLHLVDIKAVDLEMEPSFNAPTDVIFRLFTRTNPTAAQTVQLNNNAQLTASNYNPALQTRFHIHGNIIVKIQLHHFSLQTSIFVLRMERRWRSYRCSNQKRMDHCYQL